MKIGKAFSAKSISAASVAADCVLAAVKLGVGSVTGSHALISDGIHSCADIFSSLVVLFGSILSRGGTKRKIPPEKAESASLFILSFLLGTTGLFIGITGFCEIFGLPESEIHTPPAYALCVSLFALATKEIMFFVTMRTAKRENDDILSANAWHHQSDALSCLGSFGGIFMARLGFPKFDPIASMVICAFIMKTAAGIFSKAVSAASRAERNGGQKPQRVQNKQKQR